MFLILISVSSHSESYVIFNYPQNGIQWIKGQGKNKNMPDARAQIGIISGEGQHHLLKVSGYDQAQKMDQWSNSNEAGVWLFKIGPLGENEPVGEPEVRVGNLLDPYTAPSCEKGGHMTCHSSSTCENVNDGFCCKCIEGWYGDGRSCLANSVPKRHSTKPK